MSARRVLSRLVVLVVLVAALLGVACSSAWAAPSDPMLGIEGLQTKLDASGGVLHGYLKTVLRGSDIVTLPVDVLAVTAGFGSGPADMSSLILFQAMGPEIDRIGGIAAGMSGSPIYVSDGVDKIVGALSYGDIFTKNGYGLATPVEAMARLDSTYSIADLSRALTRPVLVDGAVKTQVVVAPDPSRMSVEAFAGAIVAKPFSSIFIGGVNPLSPMYKAFVKHLAAAGVDVMPTQGGLSSKVSPYDAPFEGGSAIAVLAARGDIWAGGVGTVTYTSGDKVLAFGHPAYYEGDTSLFMTNAWIDGVWPSTIEPYKLGRPAALRGTLTQDRAAGIMGIDGLVTSETPVTAKATNLDTGDVATSAAYIPRKIMNSSSYNWMGIASFGAYVAGSRVFDAASNPGSGVTTTTVVVGDGSRIYSIKRTNVWSDANDVPSAVVNDVADITSALEIANGNGIAHPDIISVHVDSEMRAARNEADIARVDVAGGLRAGENTVCVSLLHYGDPATRTVEVTLAIPADAPLTGTLRVQAANNPDDTGGASDPTPGGGSTIDRRTVSQVVDELTQQADNSVIEVSFQPSQVDSLAPEAQAAEQTPQVFDPIKVTASTPWFVRGQAERVAPAISLSRSQDTPVGYGGSAVILGYVSDATGAGEIVVTRSDGGTETARMVDGTFEYETPALFVDSTFKFGYGGDESVLPVSGDLSIRVAAKTTLTLSKTRVARGARVTLSARVLPTNVGQRLSFQRLVGKSWRTIRTSVLSSSGRASYKYRTSTKGTLKFRAYFRGSSTNATSHSSTRKLVVR